MNSFFTLLLFSLFLLLVDRYVWSGIKSLIPRDKTSVLKTFALVFWGYTVISLIVLLLFVVFPGEQLPVGMRTLFFIVLGVPLLGKLLTVFILSLDDVRRGVLWMIKSSPRFVSKKQSPIPSEPTIPRSEFITKAATATGLGLAGTLVFGILSGAHDYRVRRVRLPLKNLPKKLDGLRILQLSDIHTGSFYNKTAVMGGVEMALNEKPDIITFTGDLVNDQTSEAKNYIPVFSKLTAPLGVYSVLGNHDYGDYKNWPSQKAKEQNFQDMLQAHKALGWDLLLDESRAITVEGETISLIGIQNWGGGRFPRYGDLEKALLNTAESPVKILLSHDPSHWSLQVKPEYPDIDLMLAGHTHGMQFGVEIPGFKWSPVQYNYKHWAGLYEDNNQYLYVNRGFGYIGYPGRVGILPEITVIELVKA
jgi:predicted MPP superfamily phosphohydrolase